jgi:hypothetical protein
MIAVAVVAAICWIVREFPDQTILLAIPGLPFVAAITVVALSYRSKRRARDD